MERKGKKGKKLIEGIKGIYKAFLPYKQDKPMVKKIDSAQVWTSKLTGRSSIWSSDAKIIQILVCNKYYAYHKELHTPNQKKKKKKKRTAMISKT